MLQVAVHEFLEAFQLLPLVGGHFPQSEFDRAARFEMPVFERIARIVDPEGAFDVDGQRKIDFVRRIDFDVQDLL